MGCVPQRAAPFRCPTRDEVVASLLSLLPLGRAWQSHEGGPLPYHDAAFDPAVFDADAFDSVTRPGTIQFRFWSALGSVVAFLNARLCALRLEIWCASKTETAPEWMNDYGLPDACDPFPDLCAKVRAVGGGRCDYFRDIVAAMGWSISCSDSSHVCGARAGRARAGCARPGHARSIDFLIVVDLGASPAYAPRRTGPPRAGRLRAGVPFLCAPDLSPLMCVLERIVPAHVRLRYLIQET